jgi:hypothetical protein
LAKRASLYQPTDEQRRQVMTMTGMGIIQDEIARWLAIDDKTLRKHFRRELDTGATEANLRVASSLYVMATRDKNVAAAIWWTKSRMGWKETTVNEQAGTQTIQFQHLVAARAFSDLLQQSPLIDGKADDGTAPSAPPNLMEPATE